MNHLVIKSDIELRVENGAHIECIELQMVVGMYGDYNFSLSVDDKSSVDVIKSNRSLFVNVEGIKIGVNDVYEEGRNMLHGLEYETFKDYVIDDIILTPFFLDARLVLNDYDTFNLRIDRDGVECVRLLNRIIEKLYEVYSEHGIKVINTK